jgi:hypothetical protein
MEFGKSSLFSSLATLIGTVLLVAGCGGGSSEPTTQAVELLSVRDECSPQAQRAAQAVTSLPSDEVSKDSRVVTVAVIDVSRATNVESRSLSARCFITGLLEGSLEDKTNSEVFFVLLGRNAGEFPIESFGDRAVAKEARRSIASVLVNPERPKQILASVWGDLVQGRIPTEDVECRRAIASRMLGLGIEEENLVSLVIQMCTANAVIDNKMQDLSQLTGETIPGTDIYGTLKMIDREFAGSSPDRLNIVMFSDMLDYNPANDSDLTNELKPRQGVEITKLATSKASELGSFQNREIVLLIEQPGETAGGTVRGIRAKVEDFWDEFGKASGIKQIRSMSNLSNAR